MSDWKNYAKAARNTARKQAPDLARQAAQSAARSSEKARGYTRAAGKAINEGTRESRENARKSAAAYAVVAERRAKAGVEKVRKMEMKRRLIAATRDAMLFGMALGVIWFVITRAGIQIPISALLGVILILMAIRFAYALFAKRDEIIGQEALPEEEADERAPRRRLSDRERVEAKTRREQERRREQARREDPHRYAERRYDALRADRQREPLPRDARADPAPHRRD